MTEPSTIVALISGPIVFCLTSASIRMTTSPVRWIIPKSGGFSLTNVPRPGAPFSRLRRPGRPFSHGLRLALVPGHDVDLVAFDIAAERDRRPPLHDPHTKLGGHDLSVIGVDPQLLGDLLV